MENPLHNCFFSNNVIAFGSDNDFTIKFRHVMPNLNSENKVENVLVNEINVSISPFLFKRLIAAMQDQLLQFETRNGEVKTDGKITKFPPKSE
jgi:hypothetical protein